MAKSHSGFVNVKFFFFVFFSDRWICYFMKRHSQKQNYVRRSSGNKIRLNLSDTYRGLWRQIAKNIFTVFWIWMMAVARNSIFFITEIKQWTKTKTVNNNYKGNPLITLKSIPSCFTVRWIFQMHFIKKKVAERGEDISMLYWRHFQMKVTDNKNTNLAEVDTRLKELFSARCDVLKGKR